VRVSEVRSGLAKISSTSDMPRQIMSAQDMVRPGHVTSLLFRSCQPKSCYVMSGQGQVSSGEFSSSKFKSGQDW